MKIITFEVMDHSGKTTQAKILAERLRKEGKKVLCEHFPRYNTPIGQVIKDFLDSKIELDYTAFQMLYAADQTDFIREIAKNEHIDYVILDRYDLSTVIYYMAKQGIGNVNFNMITDMQTEIIKPDITFILDIDVETAMARNTGYKDKHEADKHFLSKVCKIQEDIEKYYERKYSGFSFRKFIHIDATNSIEDIAEKVYNYSK